MASRHLSRALVLQTLFECDMTNALLVPEARAILSRNAVEFALGPSDLSFAEELLFGVLAKMSEINAVIQKAAPQWPLENVAPIDRNVLRIGLYELLFGDRQSVPPKVALNEAIELAKSFGGEQSGKFVNGVLGSVYRDIGEPQKHEQSKVATHASLAGAVLVAEDTRSVALVRDVFHHWTLPKSELEKGELTADAAQRALLRELGITATLIRPLGEHTYIAHEPRGTQEKSVAYFLATVPTAVPLVVPEDGGVVVARWFSAPELADIPLYEDLRGIIADALA